MVLLWTSPSFSLSFLSDNNNKQINNNSISVSSNYCQNFNFLFLLIELVLSFVPTTIKRNEIERNEENVKKKKEERKKNK